MNADIATADGYGNTIRDSGSATAPEMMPVVGHLPPSTGW
jgi:hypothetical protein